MERIIVPVDFGAASDAALSCARTLAKRHDSTVVIVHVLPVTAQGVIYGEVVAIPASLMTRLEGYQDEKARKRVADKIHEFGLGELRTVVKLPRGDIAESVLGVATSSDLIVLGANQRHLTRAGLGEELARRSPCPILACHALEQGQETPSFKQGVIAIDGSELAGALAAMAAKIVDASGALEFVHVVDPSPVHHVATDMSGAMASPSEANALATAETVLAFEEWIAEQDLGVKTTGFVANDPPAQAVLERAVMTEADFVACGAHSADDVQPLGLAEMLVRHAPIPVLIVNG